MAYCSVFLYRVPRRKSEAFVHALKPIMKLFEDAGALSDELLRPTDTTAKFGGASLPLALELSSDEELWIEIDRKSTRLNSSHLVISYAVFCLKKKKKKEIRVYHSYKH